MQSKTHFLSLVQGATLAVLLAGPAWAANVNMTLIGTPSTAKQGETKSFTITIEATGALNLDHVPAAVTVQTTYTVGGGAGTPDTGSLFMAPATPDEGCETFKNGATAGDCRPSQAVAGGPYALGASVSVPGNLPPGEYLISLVASATAGLTLPSPLPSFTLVVEPAGRAPSVTIVYPQNNGSYKVNEPVTAAVEVVSSLSMSVAGALNSTLPIPLVFTATSGQWEQPLILNTPGLNTYAVTAVNAAGEGKDEVSFTVHYDFGGWLPPITTAKFQRGRTLPVKFRVNDYYGATATALVRVFLDGIYQGQAQVFADADGIPYYQFDVKLDVGVGPHTIHVAADDGVATLGSSVILVK